MKQVIYMKLVKYNHVIFTKDLTILLQSNNLMDENPAEKHYIRMKIVNNINNKQLIIYLL